MSAPMIAINLTFVALLLLAAFLIRGMCRMAAVAERAAAAQARGTTVWDDAAGQWKRLAPGQRPGPGQYTVADVAALDGLVLAWDAPAFDPATDPQWAAGRARLLNDLNNPTGDQT